MKLWDHQSPIKWAYNDYPSTIEDMKGNPEFEFFLDTDIVLFDDGRDKVYSYCTLDELKARYGIISDSPSGALYRIKSSMSKHIPTNSELSRASKDNKLSIKNNDDKIATLASSVANQSTVINAQNNQINTAVNNSKKAVEQIDYLSISNESNSLAIEDLIPLSLDSNLSSSANADAIEDIIPRVLDNSEFAEVVSLAVEDVIMKVYEEEDKLGELLDRIDSINSSMTEIKDKLRELNERLDKIDSSR